MSHERVVAFAAPAKARENLAVASSSVYLNPAPFQYSRPERLTQITDLDSVRTRFWSKVHIAAMDSCWLWQGGTDKDGYGIFHITSSQPIRAHCMSYMLIYGYAAHGLCACHHCDNPACCNPAHVFLGTQADNIADKVQKGRQAKGNTHGTNVHPESIRRGTDRPDARINDTIVCQILTLLDQGVSQWNVARMFGLAQCTIKRIKQRKTWAHVTVRTVETPSPPPPMERRKKLSNEQKMIIAERVKAGERVYELAEEYGVHFMTIYRAAKLT